MWPWATGRIRLPARAGQRARAEVEPLTRFESFAYVLLQALRCIGLRHTRFAGATCGTIRLADLRLGARSGRHVAGRLPRCEVSGPGEPPGSRPRPPSGRRRLRVRGDAPGSAPAPLCMVTATG
jgi:hypothetical protein